MPIPNDIDFTAFDTLTAAQMDDLIENDNALADGTAIDALSYGTTAIHNPYKFRVYLNSAQNSSAFASRILFDTRTYDTSSNLNITTNKGRFTAPIAGFYHFDASANYAASASATGTIGIFKNGSQVSQGNQATSSSVIESTISDTVQLAANDYIEIWPYNSASTALATGPLYTYFSGFLVSAT